MIDLRVPRTKEEIEANYEKRQAAHLYVDKLGKMEFSGLKLKSEALMQKVSQYNMWTQREWQERIPQFIEFDQKKLSTLCMG